MKLKKYITEKNLLYLFIGILIITTIADIYTAVTSPIFEVAETNPIYMLTGNITPLLFLNVLIVLWIMNSLRKSISILKIFVFCMITLYLSLGHGYGIWSNVTATNEYLEDPEGVTERVENYEAKDKLSAYMILVGLVMLLPIVISIIAFVVAMYFYEKRQPKRNKIINQVYRLTKKLMIG